MHPCYEVRKWVLYLITEVQSKHNGQHASRGVPAMVLCPAFMNVLKEAWVHHHHLQTQTHHKNSFVLRETDILISIIFRYSVHTLYITPLWYLKGHTHFIFICLHNFFHSHVGPEEKKISKHSTSDILQMPDILKQYGKLRNISILINNNNLHLNISVFQWKTMWLQSTHKPIWGSTNHTVVFILLKYRNDVLACWFCCVRNLHFDIPSWKGTGHPLKVSQFKGEQDKMNPGSQIHSTLRVHDVVSGLVPYMLLKTQSLSFIHPVRKRRKSTEKTLAASQCNLSGKTSLS